MGTLNSLLFELSSEDRLKILTDIQREPQKMTQLAKRFGWTVQETSRNLARLEKASLISKNREGEFELCPYGEDTLTLLQGFEFVSRNREYLMTHSLSRLPKPWLISMAALSGCSSSDDVMMLFHNVEEMIRHAKDFIWILTDQVLASTIPLLSDAARRGVEFRLILPSNPSIPQNLIDICSNDPDLNRAGQKGVVKARFIDTIDIVISISEKEVGLLSFPSVDGKLDYRGFYSKDEATQNWCKSLYSHIWDMSSVQIPKSLQTPQLKR